MENVKLLCKRSFTHIYIWYLDLISFEQLILWQNYEFGGMDGKGQVYEGHSSGGFGLLIGDIWRYVLWIFIFNDSLVTKQNLDGDELEEWSLDSISDDESNSNSEDDDDDMSEKSAAGPVSGVMEKSVISKVVVPAEGDGKEVQVVQSVVEDKCVLYLI